MRTSSWQQPILWHRLSTCFRWADKLMLVTDVMTPRGWTTLPLMGLHQQESFLDAGRFAHYQPKRPRTHGISVLVSGTQAEFEEMIELISRDEAKVRWNVQVSPASGGFPMDNPLLFRFWFEQEPLAIMFMLAYGGVAETLSGTVQPSAEQAVVA